METILIDTSEEWVGIIVGEELILKVLNSKLKKRFGRPVHMRELRLSEKFSVLRIFNHLFPLRSVKLYSLKPKAKNWWIELIKQVINKRITTLYVDKEVDEILRRDVHPSYLRQLNIYLSKEDIQCVDVLAWRDSHRDLVKNIWSDVSIIRGDH